MPVSKNTWNKGLNSDFSKLKSQQDSYLDAKNIRVMTDEGSSTFAIENIKGNEFSFNLPAVEATYQLSIVDIEGTLYIDIIRGIEMIPIIITNVQNKSNEFITEEINSKIENFQYPFPGKEYIRFYYNSTFIVMYDFLPESLGLSPLIINAYLPSDPTNRMVLRTDRIATHTILGWGYYDNTIVLISCHATSNSETPSDEEGFIWAATYDNETNTIQAADIDGDYLNPNTTLKYAGKLDLSRQYAIYKHLKCRYENNYTARIVWTDWNSNLRTCNVLDPQIWATPPELFSYVPIHAPQKPVITQVINGGTLPTGKYQYFYQLSSNQGAISSYSPVSNLMFAYIGDSIDYGTSGSNPGVGSGKSIEVYMQNLDVNYDTVRTGYIVYQIADFPEAFFFDERPVPDSGNLTVIHNGNENDISVDSTAVANLNRPPQVFKTIDVVRNRLFAANAITTKFDLTDEFDSRAYRYDSNRKAKLYNSEDSFNNPSVVIDQLDDSIIIEGSNPLPIDYDNFLLIPETFDCINPFNQESDALNDFANGDWYNNAQYKYDFLGTTIGGTGPNISYQFVTHDMVAKIARWDTANKYINPGFNYAINYTYEFSDTYSYPGGRGLTMDTLKNPILETLFTGYSRGEVYRFGIVFYDIYGYPSYPLWIGDIKFPFASDDEGAFGLTSLSGGGSTELPSPATFLMPDSAAMPATGGPIDLYDNGENFYIYYGTVGTSSLTQIFLWQPESGDNLTQFVNAFNAGNTIGMTASGTGTGNQILWTAPDNNSIWTNPNHEFVIEMNEGGPYTQFQLIGEDVPGYSADGNNVVVKQLGITFSLNTQGAQFQAIKGKISGYSYVRLKREQADSTRLGTGCIQPTFAASGDKYLLTPFEWNGYKWGFDLNGTSSSTRVRLGIQTYYAPNFVGQSLPGFVPEDYFRFIGRTFNYNSLVKYADYITTPDYQPNNNAYYIASNDFTYYYSDPANSLYIEQSQPTNSYLQSYNKFPIKTRVSVPYSTTGNTVTINGKTFINMASANYTEDDSGLYKEWGTQCIAVDFDDAVNFPDSTIAFDNTVLKLPFYLVSYERYLAEQYRGWTRADRYANEYILTNHFQPIVGVSDISSDVYGGDTYVNYFDWQKTNINYFDGSGYNVGSDDVGRAVAIFFPAEATFNTDMNIVQQRAAVRQNTDSILQSNYQFNPAYSQQNTTNIFVSKGYLQSNVVEEPHTIYPSQPKLDGESSDSWRTLLINDALSVNGNYGEINRVVQFKDRLFYYQNDGIGIASTDERVLQNDGETTQTQLGTGTVLQRFDYITTETGCKHSFAVEATGDGLYHYDAFINKLFKYTLGKTKVDSDGMSPLTDIKGLSGFFRTTFVNSNIKSEDKILRTGSRVGIVSSFNSEYNTVYFTFFDQANGIKYTISYNELIDSFESFYDFFPSMYINMRKRFLSLSTESTFSKVYTHNTGIRNTFYGAVYPSTVTFRVNENSDFVKTFDNFQLNTEVILDNLQLAETVSRMSITNDYQIFTDKDVNFVQKIRSWRLAIPRDETNLALTIKPRISDKYIDVKFTHNPLGLDKTFRLHDVITEYSMRSKIVPK